jgi:threonyl-tRNA synthetase
MKFLIINKKGKAFELEEYLQKEVYSESFHNLIKREALNEALPSNDAKPEYLKYASKFGFNWEENADIGLAQYDYKAHFIMNQVKEYAKQLVNKIGFPVYEVSGSNIWDMSHPEVQAYANLFGDRLYQFKSGERDVVMSYDASYPQFNLASKKQLSYKDLPFSHFSISDCYRREQSGECMLLYRQRRFNMPDLHPYFKNVAEAFEWYPKIEKQIIDSAKEANINYEVIAEVSSEKHWRAYQKEIIEIAKNLEQDILIGIRDDNVDRYWIINVDYKIIDSLGQAREIACIQIDIGNAERLDISYIDENNQKQYPAIIHSAVPGGIERYLYMIFDNFKENMPIWLYPVQIRLLPISDKFIPFCEKLLEERKGLSVRIDIDDRVESISKKIKDAREELIPYYFVIGEKEAENNIDFQSAVNSIIERSKDMPFRNYNWPKFVSKQIR